MIQIRAALKQFSINDLAGLALGFALLAAVLAIPFQIFDFALPVIPRAQLASAPDIQTRTTLGDVPYQILLDAHNLLPADARVLLVTDGTDVRHREYTTFHRALYYLTPRSVWWHSPAPADGTWESRWWHNAPLTESAVSAFAQSKNVAVILLFTDQDLFPAHRTLARWDGAKLVPFQDRIAVSAPIHAPEFAPADWPWRVLAALALFFFNGALLLYVLEHFGLDLAPFEWFALSWCLGVGLVTFLLLGSLAIGFSLAPSLWIAATAALLSAVLLCYRLGSGTFRFERFPMRGAGPATRNLSFPLLLLIVLQTAYVALIALGQPLTYWDSWVTWSMKARALFLEQTLSAAILTDASRAVTHLDYPLLLPLAQAALYQFLGAPDDRLVGWIALGFFLALVSLVYSAARTFGATRYRALLAAAVVGALPTVALLAAQNYADIPLAAYAVLTVTFLLRWIEQGKRGALVVAILGAACLGWTKREGLVLALAISTAALILYFRHPHARYGALACALASGLVALSWTVWLAAQGTNNTDLLPLTLSNLVQNLDRVPTILFYFAGTLISVQWAFVWVCAAILLLARLVRPADTTHDLYLVAALLYVAVLSMTYLFSNHAPYTAHLASSGYRLIAHVTPLVVIWLALHQVATERSSKINNPLAVSAHVQTFR